LRATVHRLSENVDPMPRPIVLLGLMGSGKTTVGTLLARRLGRPFLDGDARLEAMTGKTAAQLAAERGTDVLHRLEVEVLARSLGERPEPVIAAAAAVVLDPRVPSLLGAAWSVWLRTDVTELVSRLAGGDDHRPLARADLLGTLREMARNRDPLYASVADLSVDARRAPTAVVRRIVEAMPAGV
jgi:shikimate kinase